jgi:hypothetical protein
MVSSPDFASRVAVATFVKRSGARSIEFQISTSAGAVEASVTIQRDRKALLATLILSL